jgi:hypothetical protein
VDFEVVCWSHPDYDEVVAEITFEDGIFAIVRDREPHLMPQVHILPRADRKPWDLPLETITAALKQAEADLRALG